MRIIFMGTDFAVPALDAGGRGPWWWPPILSRRAPVAAVAAN
jgi:hypothetical protein